jgi:hypothetical protein
MMTSQSQPLPQTHFELDSFTTAATIAPLTSTTRTESLFNIGTVTAPGSVPSYIPRPPDSPNFLFGGDINITDNAAESKERRLLELRLQHNYIDQIAQPFFLAQGAEVKAAWMREVPQLAIQYENVLYAMLAISATHLLRSDADNPILHAARQHYLVMSLSEHGKAIDRLDDNDRSVDAACFASLLILINSFAMLHERDHNTTSIIPSYLPPMSWFEMGRGAFTVICYMLDRERSRAKADPAASNQSFASTPAARVIVAPPVFWDDPTLYQEPNRRAFDSILTQSIHPSGDGDWDAPTQETYEKTLSYIGAIYISIQNGEPTFAVCRRIQCFPMWIPGQFIEFVREQRPRALVMLAHLFAMVVQVRAAVWWIGETGQKEIRAIQRVLPERWQQLMIWPMLILSESEL